MGSPGRYPHLEDAETMLLRTINSAVAPRPDYRSATRRGYMGIVRRKNHMAAPALRTAPKISNI